MSLTQWSPLLLAAIITACAPPTARSDSAATLTNRTAEPSPAVAISMPTVGSSPTPFQGEAADPRATLIGKSVQGRPIEVYRFGTGPRPVLLIGGIHGGYEWNTVWLAYQMIDHLAAHPASIPAGVTIYVIPSANPDGLYAVTGKTGRFAPGDVGDNVASGRLNADQVDLNRNWGCNWQPTAEWKNQMVSAGSAAFSEPETRAVRDLIVTLQPRAVVVWHSAAGGVFGGGCGRHSVFDQSKTLAGLYAKAAGYMRNGSSPAGGDRFTAYPITGDAANWISLQGIPALVVELASHDRPEFEQNWRGLKAIIAALGP